MQKRYAVGIDLGTSNSALAFAPIGNEAPFEVLPVTQLLSFQTIGEREITLTLPDGATVEHVRACVGETYPLVKPFLPNVVCAVGEEYYENLTTEKLDRVLAGLEKH